MGQNWFEHWTTKKNDTLHLKNIKLDFTNIVQNKFFLKLFIFKFTKKSKK